MERFNDDVAEGKLIEETSYTRRSTKHKQVLLENIKVDFIDVKNKVLHETKKSSKNLYATTMQMKYYLYIIGDNYKGLIEVPTERFKEHVTLTEVDKIEIEKIMADIEVISNSECPDIGVNKSKEVCKNCSFFEFCYS